MYKSRVFEATVNGMADFNELLSKDGGLVNVISVTEKIVVVYHETPGSDRAESK